MHYKLTRVLCYKVHLYAFYTHGENMLIDKAVCPYVLVT